MTTLYKHQLEFLKQNPNKSALVWSCGTGKTRTALEWVKQNYQNYNPYERCIIVCPKPLKANWEREVNKSTFKGFYFYKVMSKEEFRRDWKELEQANYIIVDEVHNGFLTPHFKSQMSQALRNYIKRHNVPRVLLLSATVYTSSPWNIYQLATLLGYKWDWYKFYHKFFNRVRMGRREVPVAKAGCEKDLAKIIKNIASVVNIYDVLDVPLQQHCEPEYFALSEAQKTAIKDNYDPLPIVRYTNEHEIENGVLLANEFRKEQYYETDKEERIISLCEENKKIAIICRYNAQIDAYKESLERSTKRNVLVIRGDIKDRDKVCQTAELSEEAIVLIQADCAEGYELPSFPLCVFASMSYSYTKWEQICGRFLRMNKPSRTTFLYLLTEGESVDQGVYDAVKRKEDFKIELFKK